MTKKKKKESWKEKRRRATLRRQKALEAERLRSEREQRKGKGWSRSKVVGIVFLVMLLLVIGVYAALQNTQPASVSKQKAPLFTLNDVMGRKISLEDLTGKVVVINFFDLSCQPCRDEVLYLSKVYEQYNNSDVVILSIDVQPYSDTVSELHEFRKAYQIGWEILVGTSEVSDNYNVKYTPTTFVVDRKGFIYGDHEGPYNPYAYVGWQSTYISKLQDEINRFLSH